MGSRRIAEGSGVALLVAVLAAAPSLALEPSRAMSQYHCRSWADQALYRSKEGGRNRVTAVVMGPG